MSKALLDGIGGKDTGGGQKIEWKRRRKWKTGVSMGAQTSNGFYNIE